MARKKANIHYLYKTTCLITGRYYIGMHSTSNLEDGYMGSGKRLRYSIRKHGIDNHKKEILEFFESRELLIEAEKKAITPEILIDDMCMNLAEGGTGGYGSKFLSKEQLIKGRERCDEILKEKYGKNFKNVIIKNYHDKLTETEKNEHKLKIIKGQKDINYDNKTFFGKQHSEETKLKMRDKKLGKYEGKNHPQYGSFWITNDIENRKIKKDGLIPDGWRLGRK